MRRAHEAEAHAIGQLHGLAEGHGAEACETLLRLLHGVQGQRGGVLGTLLLIVVGRVFFLQIAGVGQDDAAQIHGRRSRVDRSLKAFLVEAGNPSAMVQMSVGEDDGLDLSGRNRQVSPILEPPFFLSLEESAIDQQLVGRRLPALVPFSLWTRCLEPVTVPAAPRN